MKNAVSVFSPAKKYGRESRQIKNLGGKLPGLVRKKRVIFDVCLVSNREIRDLNRRFLGKNRATNVLSFEADPLLPRPDIKKNTRYLGEIFLAPEYIRARGESLPFLLIHGFLHLLGYTHKGKRDRIKMEKLENKLLCLISSPDWILAPPKSKELSRK